MRILSIVGDAPITLCEIIENPDATAGAEFLYKEYRQKTISTAKRDEAIFVLTDLKALKMISDPDGELPDIEADLSHIVT